MKRTSVVDFTLASAEYTISAKVSALICKGYCFTFPGFIAKKKCSPVSQPHTYPFPIDFIFLLTGTRLKHYKQKGSISILQMRKLRHRTW